MKLGETCDPLISSILSVLPDHDIRCRLRLGREGAFVIKIDEPLLIRLAGVRAFAQAILCFEEGRVSKLETSDKSTRAVVRGDDTHEVCLRHTHSMIEGDCDCEASGGIDFCRHCVAVTLALQDGLSTRKPIPKRGAMTAIRRHMSEFSREALLDEFMEIVGQDRSLRDDLYQKVQFASGALTYTDLKKMIAGVELDGEPWDFQEVQAFFEKFESLLLRINERADRLDPLVLLRVAEHAVQRFNAEVRQIDYYGDYWDLSTELLVNLHLSAVNRLDWPPGELAAYVVNRYSSTDWHPVHWGADLYARDLGDTFRRAMLSEIDTRLAAVSSSDSAESESVRDELEELKANVAVADGENG
jgi:hypothetical protein